MNSILKEQLIYHFKEYLEGKSSIHVMRSRFANYAVEIARSSDLDILDIFAGVCVASELIRQNKSDPVEVHQQMLERYGYLLNPVSELIHKIRNSVYGDPNWMDDASDNPKPIDQWNEYKRQIESMTLSKNAQGFPFEDCESAITWIMGLLVSHQSDINRLKVRTDTDKFPDEKEINRRAREEIGRKTAKFYEGSSTSKNK